MKQNPLATILLNILSVFLLCIGSIQLWQIKFYIVDVLAQGYVSWGKNFTTIIAYISDTVIHPFCFSIIFYVLGKMYAKR